MKNKKFIKIAKNVIDLEIKALQQMKKTLNNSFNDSVVQITKCQSKVILCGVGKSGLIAAKILSCLKSSKNSLTGNCPIFFNKTSSLAINNLGGPLGANISDFLFTIFGQGSFLILLIGIVWALQTIFFKDAYNSSIKIIIISYLFF